VLLPLDQKKPAFKYNLNKKMLLKTTPEPEQNVQDKNKVSDRQEVIWNDPSGVIASCFKEEIDTFYPVGKNGRPDRKRELSSYSGKVEGNFKVADNSKVPKKEEWQRKYADYSLMKIDFLRGQLKARELSTLGRKKELVERLEADDSGDTIYPQAGNEDGR